MHWERGSPDPQRAAGASNSFRLRYAPANARLETRAPSGPAAALPSHPAGRMNLVERVRKAGERIDIVSHRSALRFARHENLGAVFHGLHQALLVTILFHPGGAGIAVVL